MNLQVTKPFAAEKLPPRAPTLPELIERAWEADRLLAGAFDADWNRLNEADFAARQALMDHLLDLGVTRDLARKLGELV